MNKKNKKSFELIKEIIESPKLNEILNNTEQEQLETEIYRILIDIELNEKILADKNKWIVELLNEIETQRKEIKKLKDEYIIQRDLINPDFMKDYISKDKVRDIIKCLDHEPYTAFDGYGELLYDTEIDIKQKLEKLL